MSTTKRYRFDYVVYDAAKPEYDSLGRIKYFNSVGKVSAHSDTHAIREAKKIAMIPLVELAPTHEENRNAR